MNLINKDSKILIVGDSWGCGEWGLDPHSKKYTVLHKGLEQYLIDFGCTVTNLSVGGCSNDSIFRTLKEQIQFSYDVIIWFQTDPLRNLRPYLENLEIFKKEKDDFILVHDELLDLTYKKFNSLNTPIYCLGGTTRLDLDLMKKYSNLHPVIPSIAEFFGDVQVRIWPSSWVQEFASKYEKIFTESLLNYLYSECNINLSVKWFYPDGGHPNRAAHEKIFECLKNYTK